MEHNTKGIIYRMYVVHSLLFLHGQRTDNALVFHLNTVVYSSHHGTYIPLNQLNFVLLIRTLPPHYE
jgi:hypothetical protein